MNDLKKMRQQIDALDREIVLLLDKRLEIAENIGKVKKAQGLPLYDSARESERIAEVKALARHPLLKLHIESLYSTIISLAREAQLS